MMKYKRAGFIFSEMVMAILLIIVLSAATLLAAHSYIDAGKRSAAAADTATLGGYISQYKMEVGSYPEKLEDLTKTKGQYGPWVREIPQDPYGNDYYYVKDDKKGFVVFSGGKDGRSSSGINGISGDDIGYSE